MTIIIRPTRGVIEWEYLEGVQGIVLVAREDKVPVAVIEMRPCEGFRLTDCRTGEFQTFMSLDEAKQAHFDRR
jgi:hypothetical protein